MTFSKECFDIYLSTIRFLTFGRSILQELLSQVENSNLDSGQAIFIKASAQEDISMRMWFVLQENQCKKVATFKDIKQMVKIMRSVKLGVDDLKTPEA